MSSDQNQTTAATDAELRAAGAWGRSILQLADASVDHSAFSDAWRTYAANSGFGKLSGHERALIRIAFVAGWRARGMA